MNRMQRLRTLLLPLAFLALALLPFPGARAAALTRPQVQAILSVLASFGVDESTVADVRAILEGRPKPHLPPSGNQTSYPYLVILAPAAGTTTAGVPLSIAWQGIYANSVYVLSLAPTAAPLSPLASVSVTAFDAHCSIGLSCSYTWTPAVAATSSTLTVRDQLSEKSGTVSPLIFTAR